MRSAGCIINDIVDRNIDLKVKRTESRPIASNKISLIEENASNKLKQQIEKRKLGASVKIDQMKRDANNEIKNYITQTSIATVSELLEEKLSKKDQQNLINDSINELSSSLKN